jgi:uncharacterized protein YndB with AHSA1/START domain
LHNVLIAAPPEAVWKVLADPCSYPEWVLGTRRIESADPDWPARDAELRYEARLGPFRFRGRSTVRHVEAPTHLELEADAGLLSARVAITVRPWAGKALAIVEEHWIAGSPVLLTNPMIDIGLHLRNRWMVKDLARAVERRAGSG